MRIVAMFGLTALCLLLSAPTLPAQGLAELVDCEGTCGPPVMLFPEDIVGEPPRPTDRLVDYAGPRTAHPCERDGTCTCNESGSTCWHRHPSYWHCHGDYVYYYNGAYYCHNGSWHYHPGYTHTHYY